MVQNDSSGINRTYQTGTPFKPIIPLTPLDSSGVTGPTITSIPRVDRRQCADVITALKSTPSYGKRGCGFAVRHAYEKAGFTPFYKKYSLSSSKYAKDLDTDVFGPDTRWGKVAEFNPEKDNYIDLTNVVPGCVAHHDEKAVRGDGIKDRPFGHVGIVTEVYTGRNNIPDDELRWGTKKEDYPFGGWFKEDSNIEWVPPIEQYGTVKIYCPIELPDKLKD